MENGSSPPPRISGIRVHQSRGRDFQGSDPPPPRPKRFLEIEFNDSIIIIILSLFYTLGVFGKKINRKTVSLSSATAAAVRVFARYK